jgi:hypothetical protein
LDSLPSERIRKLKSASRPGETCKAKARGARAPACSGAGPAWLEEERRIRSPEGKAMAAINPPASLRVWLRLLGLRVSVAFLVRRTTVVLDLRLRSPLIAVRLAVRSSRW